ncbi:MAG: hypothetical protein ABR498_06675 [Candidatus Dormibacteria bacterium]
MRTLQVTGYNGKQRPTLAAMDQQLGGGEAPGIGFAIPSNTLKAVASQPVQFAHVVGRASWKLTLVAQT